MEGILALCYIFALAIPRGFAADPVGDSTINIGKSLENVAQFSDDVVVADAVFESPYAGVVRMIQKISDDSSGDRSTTVMVRLRYPTPDAQTTEKHMWHVEHDPVTGVDCAAENKHFAPFGITKEENYTTYCSGKTPDFCEVGDISTKTTLTSVGADVVNWYNVPFLPVVGPWTVIGHSVNVHGGAMSKVRRACANIVLNKRMTPAREVFLPVKMPDDLDSSHLTETRMRIARQLGIPMRKVQTALRLDTLSTGCVNMNFLIFGRGLYDESKLNELRDGKVDIGPLSPVSCTVSGKTVRSSDSQKKDCGDEMEGSKTYQDRSEESDKESGDYEVVADALFRGVYVGVVRMTQKITSNQDGYPMTEVIVRLKNASNPEETKDHMWHVEHDAIDTNDCAAENKHYAPYGITKEPNYTTYCSGNTPDYCELGDISTKTGLTKLGQNVVNVFSVPLLPIVGPRTMIGHSVNVHGPNKSKVRQACGNILLNKKMTRANFVDIPLKVPEGGITEEHLTTARTKMSAALGISLAKVHTAIRLDTVQTGCVKMEFLIFDRGTYCPDALAKLEAGEVDLGGLTPTGCQMNRNIDNDDTTSPGNDAVQKTLSIVVTSFAAAAALIMNFSS